jgi:hypothetical protein
MTSEAIGWLVWALLGRVESLGATRKSLPKRDRARTLLQAKEGGGTVQRDDARKSGFFFSFLSFFYFTEKAEGSIKMRMKRPIDFVTEIYIPCYLYICYPKNNPIS